jgi:hypothetical protein
MSLLYQDLKIREGKYIRKLRVGLRITEDRIIFAVSPFSKGLNAKIKTMDGWKFDFEAKKWSIANSPRNVFQLRYLWGENVYGWWQQPLIDLEASDFQRVALLERGFEIAPQQVDMVRRGLTYHYQLLAAEQGLGKSLAAIEIMERSGLKDWWYIGPRSAMESVLIEMRRWEIDPSVEVNFMTYQGLVKQMRYDEPVVPDGIIFDEISKAKTPSTHTAKSCQHIADLIREKHGYEGYVIGLSGTPTAKTPLDCWKPLEVIWPGYMTEGSYKAFEHRYGIVELSEDMDGVKFYNRVGWNHEEIAKMPKRYDGLMPVYRLKDWLVLPEKTFHVVQLEPSKKVMRVAKMLTDIAPNAITALTWCRALSSGFQYRMKENGSEPCDLCNKQGMYTHTEGHDPVVCPNCNGTREVPTFERETKMVKTPKDNALRELLDANETKGRIVVAAAFQGSIDRVLAICRQRGWAVAAVDGRGWRAYDNQGGLIKDKTALELWEDHPGKVAFVGNPGSCGYGLTLTAANAMVFFDNDFSAEKRLQMVARIWRMSQLYPSNIYDLCHLPVDNLVLETLGRNLNMELLSLGAIQDALDVEDGDDELEEEEIL